MNGIQFIVGQMQGYRPPPATREEMRMCAVEMHRTMSQRQVARRLGVSRSTVFNLLQEQLSMEGRNA